MAHILPRLTPWWFTPENEVDAADPPKFKLRPLTQPQLVELEQTYNDKGPTAATWYRAGELTIMELDNVIDPDSGKPAKWPQMKARIPASWVMECGADAWMKANGETDEPGGEGLEKN